MLSNTFRHPAILAKQATVLDHATGGRFILGLGAGWHEGEHGPFGIAAAADRRADRPADQRVEVLRALFSAEAAGAARRDARRPVLPAPRRDQPARAAHARAARRSTSAARSRAGSRSRPGAAQGWLLTGTEAGDVEYFTRSATEMVRALEAEGRDPATFEFVAQVHRRGRGDRGAALEGPGGWSGRRVEVIIGIPAFMGPAALEAAARQVRDPLRDEFGPLDDRHGPPRWRSTTGRGPGVRPDPQRRPAGQPGLAGAPRLGARDVPGPFDMLLAEDPDGTVIGAASCGRIYMLAPEYERSWLGLWVIPERGGRAWDALLVAAGEAARGLRQDRLRDRAVGGARGGASLPRRARVHGGRAVDGRRADLAGGAAAEPPPGSGSRPSPRTRPAAGRPPDRRRGVPGHPDPDEPMDAATFEGSPPATWTGSGCAGRPSTSRSTRLRRGRRVRVADVRAGLHDHRLARHDRGPARWRGRGIATVLKRATIAWAIANGVERSRPATTRPTRRCAP